MKKYVVFFALKKPSKVDYFWGKKKNSQEVNFFSKWSWPSASFEPKFVIVRKLVWKIHFLHFTKKMIKCKIYKIVRMSSFAIRNNPTMIPTYEKKLIIFVHFWGFKCAEPPKWHIYFSWGEIMQDFLKLKTNTHM